jgi:RNA polymerase sigma-70 factor (ECF subfamily)
MLADSPGISTRLTLIDRVRKLDPQGWDEFVRIYDSLLLAYVQSNVRRLQLKLNEQDCEDIKQNLLIKLYRTLPGFDFDRKRGRFRTWLWQVAHTAVVDWGRQRGDLVRGGGTDGPPEARPALVFSPDLPDQVAGDVPPPDEEAIENHMWEVRRHILEKVAVEMQSAQKWECFDKHFLQGRASADVAAELDMSVSAVNTYTSRVLTRIRELCQYYDAEF